MAKYAGTLISPPPPAIASTKAAKKPAEHKNIILNKIGTFSST